MDHRKIQVLVNDSFYQNLNLYNEEESYLAFNNNKNLNDTMCIDNTGKRKIKVRYSPSALHLNDTMMEYKESLIKPKYFNNNNNPDDSIINFRKTNNKNKFNFKNNENFDQSVYDINNEDEIWNNSYFKNSDNIVEEEKENEELNEKLNSEGDPFYLGVQFFK